MSGAYDEILARLRAVEAELGALLADNAGLREAWEAAEEECQKRHEEVNTARYERDVARAGVARLREAINSATKMGVRHSEAVAILRAALAPAAETPDADA